MEAPVVNYDKDKYFETQSGNKICKQTLIRGSEHIRPRGKTIIMPGAVLRGDLSTIQIGKYGIIGEDVVLRPSFKRRGGSVLKFVPISIGDHVFIGKGSIICASKIGNNVEIGENVVIGHRCMIKDNCKILPDSVLPDDTLVPPFTCFGGRPATYLGDLPESISLVHKERTMEFYKNFKSTR
mmetsp:Transcript_65111/g.74829  ORF Transcript_65111/g.74829 Transcript_65111/m.74829 type:complete len:182 (-) Transcript_65111:102-647(-)|eukprot:CAMPEP_0115034508 /NCGR_PEP_ID=MMETSP0216-20121206/40700_1 /TAXON_ID=223996 /ORGANISM="Protocruzia adherens, Strain Boccale" /LENGTH=181 /DNA_ID=CAMNT_0002413421 /DNA_START=32 /DNA_END=577 /DNA_ORIENTATION=-